MSAKSFDIGAVRNGLELKRSITIGEDRVIKFMGDELRVYETPAMISDIEYACRDLLFENLPSGWDSVGVVVDIRHLAATPLGESVSVCVMIDQITGRRVRFQCEVRDAEEIVGDGIHERFLVDIAKHRQRIGDKKQRMQGMNSGG